MRRAAALTALALALGLVPPAAAPVAGQNGQNVGQVPQSPGALWVDARWFGARADNGVTDNSGPIQRAIDYVADRPGSWGNHGGTVFLPSAPTPYGLLKPVFLDRDGVTLRGEGAQTTQLLVTGYNRYPAILAGIRRGEPYSDATGQHLRKPDASNRVPCAGKLDKSATTTTRWGYRTNNDRFIQFAATPLSAGRRDPVGADNSDEWAKATALTVEVCLEPPDGKDFPANTPLLGGGVDDPPGPKPFQLSTWGDGRTLLFTYMRCGNPAANYDGFQFSAAGAAPPFHLCITVDLAAGRQDAWVNGKKAATSDIRDASAGRFTPFAGDSFVRNRYEPFYIGAAGGKGPVGKASTGVDGRYYGFRLSDCPRYSSDAAGNQIRLDTGAAPTDDWRYFGDDPHTVAYLPLDDSPSDTRLVQLVAGGATYGGRCVGLLYDVQDPQSVANVAVTDLTVNGAGFYGHAVGVGAVLEARFERLTAGHAWYGVGSLIRKSNYRIYVNDCNLSGTGSPYFGFEQIISARNVTFGNNGRSGVKLVGCNSRWQDVMFTTPNPGARHNFEFIGIGYGGNHVIENCMVDFEGATYEPGGAAIYCEAHPNVTTTSLRLRDVGFGTFGTGVAMVSLVGGPQGATFAPCWFDAENVGAFTAERPKFWLDGTLWRGSMRGVPTALGTGMDVVNSNRYGTGTNITFPQ